MCKGTCCACTRTNNKAFNVLFPVIDIACKGLAQEKTSTPITPTTLLITKKEQVKTETSLESKYDAEKPLTPRILSNEHLVGMDDSKKLTADEKEQSPQSSKQSRKYGSWRDKPEMTKKKHVRHYVRHDYHDHARDPPPSENSSSGGGDLTEKSPRMSVVSPFPLTLHNLLKQVQDKNMLDIISWRPHGRSFVIKNPEKFVKDIMPKYFKQTKLSSFQRQLNLYGFHRITKKGPDRGSYYHEFFLRGRPHLCVNMRRIRIKGTGVRTASSPESEPDFYKMAALESTRVSESPTLQKEAKVEAGSLRSKDRSLEPKKKRRAKSQHNYTDSTNSVDKKLPATKPIEEVEEPFAPPKSPASPEPPFQSISPIPLEYIPSLFSERAAVVPSVAYASVSTSPEPSRPNNSVPTPLPPTYDKEQLQNFLRPVVNPPDSVYLACPPMNPSDWREIFGEPIVEEETETKISVGEEEERKMKASGSGTITKWDTQPMSPQPPQNKRSSSTSSKSREDSLSSFLADIDFETDNDGYFSDSGFARLLEKAVE